MTGAQPLHLLSGGAAQGLVEHLAAQMGALGITLVPVFGAVGSMHDKLLAGAPCDVFISTAPMLQALAAKGRLDAASIRPLGQVATGLAVPQGQPLPGIADADALRNALLAAPEVHCPDTTQSTAGRHFAGVLRQLGVEQALAGRLREYPNGMTAMRALAASAVPGAVGCTQITEILHTPGAAWVGPLPGALGLCTLYSAAVVAGSSLAGQAAALVELLAGPPSTDARQKSGFFTL